MLIKRVIPCLDVHNGHVTRGVQFGKAEKGELRNVGDPVELALRYDEQGADEMVFFDITATAHGRVSMLDVIKRTADQCFMPLTVGGGIRTTDDMHAMLNAGATRKLGREILRDLRQHTAGSLGSGGVAGEISGAGE